MFEFMLPRSFAFASLSPRAAARITIDPPMSDRENFVVINLDPTSKNAIAIDERAADHTVIRNQLDVEISYLFVVLPLPYIKALRADWASLALFLKSLWRYRPVLDPTSPVIKPTQPPH